MFSTFTKQDGRLLIIRSIDLRRLEDTVHGTLLVFDECGGAQELLIQDTAAENLARIAQEELEAVQKAQAQQQRASNGLPLVPITRGRAR